VKVFAQENTVTDVMRSGLRVGTNVCCLQNWQRSFSGDRAPSMVRLGN
jgi:hypothetical protein